MFNNNEQSRPSVPPLHEIFLDLLIKLALQQKQYVNYAPAKPCFPCCCCLHHLPGSYTTTEDPIYTFFHQRKETTPTLDSATQRALWNIVELHGAQLPHTKITIRLNPQAEQPISEDKLAKALQRLEQEAPKAAQRREQIKAFTGAQ